MQIPEGDRLVNVQQASSKAGVEIRRRVDVKHDQPAEGNPSPAVPHRLPAGQTDDELAYEACEGDREAFGELANRHSVRLRRTLYRITKDCEMAKDSVQEALIRAWGAVCSFERRSKFSSWPPMVYILLPTTAVAKFVRGVNIDGPLVQVSVLGS